mmetsp:Transcript_65778/g.174380  ORF Transcript_65778/g.174380 Transcript_65778/m.174380 type:complete len:449 (-) Transcript_65778:174-1520(-)
MMSAAVQQRYITSRGIEADIDVTPVVVGTGAHAPVHRATRRRGGGSCAVKTFVKTGSSTIFQEKLKDEVNLYLKLDHPHICKLECVFETLEHVHFVMECLEGGEVLSHDPFLCEKSVAAVMRQLLRALSYLHGHGVVHRDVKPENLVYLRVGCDHVKLVDFSLACCRGGSILLKTCGTPGYMAPEVYERCYTEKADMWSAGITAFVLLTGKMPLPISRQQAKDKYDGGAPWKNAEFKALSEDAQHFVRRLLASSDRARPSAIQALRHRWLSYEVYPMTTALDTAVLQRFRRAAAASPAQRLQALAATWLKPDQTADQSVEWFFSCCDDTGSVTRRTFARRLQSCPGVSQEEAEALFNSFDDNAVGEISYRQLLTLSFLDCVVWREFDAAVVEPPVGQVSAEAHPREDRTPSWSLDTSPLCVFTIASLMVRKLKSLVAGMREGAFSKLT